MQEFSSISVSSYEPATLADQLSERSGDGWSVVAIVPTGSTVTAYLARERSGSASTSASAGSEPSPVANVAPAAAASTADTSSSSDRAWPSEPDTGVALAGGDGPGMGASPAAMEPSVEPVDEPGGWAVSPESTSSVSSSGSDSSAISPNLPSRESESSQSGTASSASTSDATTAGTTAASSAGASAAAAPAGWYADPSSRYELRYWDGSQWTEHVSRAGQQFTDPPVA